MAKHIIGKELQEALISAGIADEMTRRVIIDIPVDEIPTVFIEKYGDERLLEIVAPLMDHKIEIQTGE